MPTQLVTTPRALKNRLLPRGAHMRRVCGRLLCDAGYRPRIVHQRRVWPDTRTFTHNRWLVAEGAP